MEFKGEGTADSPMELPDLPVEDPPAAASNTSQRKCKSPEKGEKEEEQKDSGAGPSVPSSDAVPSQPANDAKRKKTTFDPLLAPSLFAIVL